MPSSFENSESRPSPAHPLSSAHVALISTSSCTCEEHEKRAQASSQFQASAAWSTKILLSRDLKATQQGNPKQREAPQKTTCACPAPSLEKLTEPKAASVRSASNCRTLCRPRCGHGLCEANKLNMLSGDMMDFLRGRVDGSGCSGCETS